MRCAVAGVLLFLAAALTGRYGTAATVPQPFAIYRRVVGSEQVHFVTSGETLGHIAARFKISPTLIAAMNRLPDPNRLHLGQRLVLSNRHIVPSMLQDGIVVNVGDLTLFWVRGGEPVGSFPVAAGRVAWKTPSGHYTITGRKRDPTWHVPPSIQKEMRERKQPVKTKVPAGPDNPLGKYWLQLSVPGYGLHGTNAPRSVGRYATHGCIRLRDDDIARLYREVPSGTAVDVVDEPIKLAQLDDGTILLEAHPSVSPRAYATFAERLPPSLAEQTDLAAARRVIQEAWGVAMDVSKKRGAGAMVEH
jgi:L,D-transpeptidase ErfK/SrfK